MASSPTNLLATCEPLTPTGTAYLSGKHVAMVTFSPFPADPRPRRAIDALRQQGMTIDLICLADESAPRREVLDGINIFRIPIAHRRGSKLSYAYNYFAFILLSTLLFASRLIKRRYDLVHVHNMPDVLILSSLIPKMFGAKVILDLHDPMPELMTTIYDLHKESLAVGIMKRLEKWSAARADLVLTVNLACKRIFSSRSCAPEKIGVVMNSPDERIFPFRKFQPRLLPEGAIEPFVIMYHGSLVERNGLDLAVEALLTVRRLVPTAELRIFGRQTSFLDKVLEQVREKNLGDCVRYLGPRSLEEIAQEIDSCDVGIIPNHRSAFAEINTPTRIFEYLAMGKPVIAPRTAGICDYFDDHSLVFFEPGNANDLAQKIQYVFANPGKIVDIVRGGQKVYCEHSWTNESGRFKSMIAEVLRGNRFRQGVVNL